MIVSDGTSELSRSLSGVIDRVTTLEGYDPALLELITCARYAAPAGGYTEV
jgi:hypothetical protein